MRIICVYWDSKELRVCTKNMACRYLVQGVNMKNEAQKLECAPVVGRTIDDANRK